MLYCLFWDSVAGLRFSWLVCVNSCALYILWFCTCRGICWFTVVYLLLTIICGGFYLHLLLVCWFVCLCFDGVWVVCGFASGMRH